MDESARILEHDLALCEKATPGPWQARQIVGVAGPMQMPATNGWELLGMTEDGMPLADWFERKDDAVFTVEARVALPYWLKANIALRTENERLREALDEIANPVKHMRDEAERKGARLNGLAIQLANNAAFLRNIARDALEVRNG